MPKRDHTWVVDGIEEGIARIEEDGKRMITVPVYLLPAGATEGHLLRVESSSGSEPHALSITITLDEDATARALSRSKATTSRAASASRKKDPGGDVTL